MSAAAARAAADHDRHRARDRAALAAGLPLGVALAGFADGILLHQILAWHHLLSTAFPDRDLAWQTWADGLFHAAHYLLAAWGVSRLWAHRRAWTLPGAGRALGGALILGFGLWQAFDGSVDHLVLGLHRVREDVPLGQRLAWDLGFLAMGVAALAVGWLVWRSRVAAGGGAAARLAASLALLVPALGAQAMLGTVPGPVLARAAFPDGTDDATALLALASADGRAVSVEGRVWTVALPSAEAAAALRATGARVTSLPGAVRGGCLARVLPS